MSIRSERGATSAKHRPTIEVRLEGLELADGWVHTVSAWAGTTDAVSMERNHLAGVPITRVLRGFYDRPENAAAWRGEGACSRFFGHIPEWFVGLVRSKRAKVSDSG